MYTANIRADIGIQRLLRGGVSFVGSELGSARVDIPPVYHRRATECHSSTDRSFAPPFRAAPLGLHMFGCIETQAVGLGCQRVATLWRTNHIRIPRTKIVFTCG